jgi:hypothetical protein
MSINYKKVSERAERKAAWLIVLLCVAFAVAAAIVDLFSISFFY